MKNNSYKQSFAILLLLLYAFSNSPFIKFHHHNSSQENFANSIIENDISDFQCSQTEIHQLEKRCALCDNHTLSAHASTFFTTENNFTLYFSHVIPSATIHNYIKVLPCPNRGPPEYSFASA
ncbi:MAG TPA: hypothetical protein VFM99_10030 [Chitinophagales bacterium]|nr:hypothetical protein [Chitinophagales bacterium]